MSRDPHKGTSNTGPGTEGLVREGMLDRLLRRLVRPRVEYPIERPQVTQSGDMELRFAPLRVHHALYDQATNSLSIVVSGGRVNLPTGTVTVSGATVSISAPAASSTYWLYLDQDGAWQTTTIQPSGTTIECASIQTPSAWPTSAALKGFVADYDSLHGITGKTAGDCWVVLSEWTTYVWGGAAWTVLVRVTDRRPWFTIPGAASGGSVAPVTNTDMGIVVQVIAPVLMEDVVIQV